MVWEDIPFSFEKNYLRRLNKKYTFKHADLFIVPVERTAETLKLEGVDPAKIRVLPMGVDLNKFNYCIQIHYFS